MKEKRVTYQLIDIRHVLERGPERVRLLVAGIDEHRFHCDIGRGQNDGLAQFERNFARETLNCLEEPLAAIARRAQHPVVRFHHVR